MTYKMLVLDLDGTTLAHGELQERDQRAAHWLADQGVVVTIATGRLFTGTRSIAHALGVQGPVAVMNGSELVDVQSGEAVFARYVAGGVIFEVLEEHGLHVMLFRSRAVHHCEKTLDLASYLGVWTPEVYCHSDLKGSLEWDQDDVVAVCGVGSDAQITAAAQVLGARGFQTEIFRTFDDQCFIKVRHLGVDKGTAVAALADVHGVAVSETVAVGDWLNDLPMLRSAGLSFAMAGAESVVLEAADQVLERIRHTGGGIEEVATRVWGYRPR